MAHLFTKIKGRYYAKVTCPDCDLEHLVSHKNYYSQKARKRNLSFRCHSCGQKRAARNRRNPELRKLTSHGYIKLYCPENPMADKRGEVYEHRLVMAEKLGRPLESHEHIHHLDGNKANNHPDNLYLNDSQTHNIITKLITENKDLKAEIVRLNALLNS